MVLLDVAHERFPIRDRFNISRGAKYDAEVVTVTATQDGVRGRGECVPYLRYNETVSSVMKRIADVELPYASAEKARHVLQRQLEAGAARNAIDCALWELESKQKGCSVRDLCGRSHRTGRASFTVSLDTPSAMAESAKEAHPNAVLKLKLGLPKEDGSRVAAVRSMCPNHRIVVDVNEGWSAEQYERLSFEMAKYNVDWIEQPLSAKEDKVLRSLARPVKVCADESVHDLASLSRLIHLYDGVNIKLDKTGGLTEALKMVALAKELDLFVMLGCMVSSSLSIAPILVLADEADLLDLDGSLLLSRDRQGGVSITEDAELRIPTCWGP